MRRRLLDYPRCSVPPRGWYCTRTRWHGGPCAARPVWWKAAWLWIRGYPI